MPASVIQSGEYLLEIDTGWDSSSFTLDSSVKGILDNTTFLLGPNTDFADVTDVDTAALSLIMEWQRRATASNCKVTFSNLPANLTSLAALYGVTEFIPLSVK